MRLRDNLDLYFLMIQEEAVNHAPRDLISLNPKLQSPNHGRQDSPYRWYLALDRLTLPNYSLVISSS